MVSELANSPNQNSPLTTYYMSIENWSSASSALWLWFASPFLSSFGASFLARSEVTPEMSEVN